jgi:hypothetical protein
MHTPWRITLIIGKYPMAPVIDRGRPRTVFRAYDTRTVHPGSCTTAQGPRPPFQQLG